MSTDYKFYGWVAKDKDSINGNLKWEEFEPKTWTEDDVDIEITHCGICASDLHTLRSGWGATDYPTVVGHEIVGNVVRVGKNVKNITLGDRVGVGAQSGSCLSCEYCTRGDEPYCNSGMIGTYASRYPDNSKSYGGYATHARLPAHFAFKIPSHIPSEIVAPMMCGGVTVFSPLVAGGAGPGKRVGVIGIGGLGHFALLFGRALGAEMVAISHSESKKKDAEQMGVVDFISTATDPDFHKSHRRTLDLIICTANNADMPMQKYLKLLKPGGRLTLVGAPEEPLPSLPAFSFISDNVALGGSLIGGTKDITKMLEVASKSDVKTWVQVRKMEEANQAVRDMEDGKARYRYVLVNEKAAGKGKL